tara:strand:- start:112 stop:333 length:222 start_codon:yes stop_codon:yes gene_type:complete
MKQNENNQNPLEEIQLPYTVDELIKVLDKIYPDRSPSLKDNEREVWFKAGQRSVVNWLIELKKRSEDNLLGGQ